MTVRLALVGLGDIAVTAHLPALRRSTDVRVVAVVDLDEGRRARALAELGDPGGEAISAYAGIDQVLERDDVDGVVLATPPWVTTGLAARALEAGRFVLAEKPIATSVAAAAPLAALDDGVRRRLQVGLTYRHDPALEVLRGWIADGPLDGPLLIRAHIYDERLDPDDAEHEARLRATLDHGPPVVHEGAHVFDWFAFLLGGPGPTVDDAWSVRTDPTFGTPNLDGARLSYAGGTTALVEFGWLTDALPRCELSFLGARAFAVLDGYTFDLTLHRDGGRELVRFDQDRTTRCFDRQLARFVELVGGQVPRAMPGWAEGVASLTLSERIAAAVATGGSERGTAT